MSAAHERARARIEQFRTQRPDAAELARLASLAVRAEPELLRTLRLELLPHADVGAEADLWFSPLVESRGTDVVVLERHVADWLRQSLAGDAVLQRVIEITRRVHENSPPSIQLEEEVNALALERGDAALPEIDAALRRAIRAMRENDARAREVARWILRAAPRLHPLVLKSPSAIALVLAASMLLGRRGQTQTLEANVALEDLGWILPPSVLAERVEIDVERTETGIRFATAANAGQLSLPRTDPLLVELRWNDNTEEQRVVIDATPGRTFELPGDAGSVIRILTLAGDEYELVLESRAATPIETAQATTQFDSLIASCVIVDSEAGTATGWVIKPGLVATVIDASNPNVTLRRIGGRAYDSDVTTLVPHVDDHLKFLRVANVEALSTPVDFNEDPIWPDDAAQLGRKEERLPLSADVIGIEGEGLRSISGKVLVQPHGEHFDLYLDEEPPAAFQGAAVLVGGRVRGIVTDWHDDPATGLIAIAASITRVLALAEQVAAVADIAEAEGRAEAPAPSGIDIAPHERIADACVRLTSATEPVRRATGFWIDPFHIITARGPFSRDSTVNVGPGSPLQRATLIHTHGSDTAIALRLEAGGAFTEPVPLATPPFVAEHTAQQSYLETSPQRAVILGYGQNDVLQAIEGRAEITDFAPREFRVLVETGWPPIMPDVLGGPVITDGRVRGIVTEVTTPEREGTSILTVVGSAVLQDLMQRVRDQERAQDQQAEAQQSPEQAQTAQQSEQIPFWLMETCAEVHALGDNITPATAFAVGRRRVLTAAANLSQIPILDVRQDNGSAQARVLDPESGSGLLVLEFIQEWRGGSLPRPIEITASPLPDPATEPVLQASDVSIVGSREGERFLLHGAPRVLDTWPDAFTIEVQAENVPAQVLGAPVFVEERFAGMVTQIRGRQPVILEAMTRYAILRELERVERERSSPKQAREAEQTGVAYQFAKVVVLGDPGSGRSALIRAIAGQPYDASSRRVVWWVDAGPRSAGILLHEVLADERWPIAFDLEHAAVAVIAEDVHDVSTIPNWLRRIRAVQPDLPVLFAGTKADRLDDDVKSALSAVQGYEREDLQRRNIDPETVTLGSTVLSAAENINLDILRNGIRNRINWQAQPELPPLAFRRARLRMDSVIQPANTILPAPVWDATWQADVQWLMPLLPAMGIRRLPDANLVVEDPQQFERVVLEITDIVRQGEYNVPARPLALIEDEVSRVNYVQDAGQSRESDESRRMSDQLTRAVIQELIRIGEAARTETDNGTVIVMPRWLGPPPSSPTEPTGAVLRASWPRGAPRIIACLAANFAYSNQNSLQEAGWNAADGTGRIHATVAMGMPVYIDFVDTGTSIDLVAEIPSRVPEDDAYTPVRILREWLDQLLSGSVEIRVEEFRARRGFTSR